LLFGIRKKHKQGNTDRNPDYTAVVESRSGMPEWCPRPVLCRVGAGEDEITDIRAIVYAMPNITNGKPVYIDIDGVRWLTAQPIKQEAEQWLRND